MKAQRLGVVAVVLAVPLVLAQLRRFRHTRREGHAPPRTGPPAPGPPAHGVAPHWPAEGCDTRSTSQIDYAIDARGARTPQEALARYVPEGARRREGAAAAHRHARWLVVDQDHVILRAVSVVHLGQGWLVDSIEQCSG